MKTLVESQARPEALTSKLRVLLMLELHDGAEDRFLDAYEHIRHQVAAVPGHLRDQLCKSIEDPSQWLITSEWSSPEQYLAWVDSPEHQLMVQPLHGCVRGTRSLRFSVTRETGEAGRIDKPAKAGGTRSDAKSAKGAKGAKAGGGSNAQNKARAATRGPAAHSSVTRAALSFTVKPGSEAKVAKILAGYESPQARVDAKTTLRRTTVFMRGNRVVRAIEIDGDLRAALQHVAAQPQVRAAEEQLNPYLEESRDLDDPEAARGFFMRSSLAEVSHLTDPRSRPQDREPTRKAFLYPVRHGSAEAAARLLADHDERAIAQAAGPIAGSTIFVREDILVRVVDLRGSVDDDPAVVLGIDRAAAARFGRLLDADVDTDAGLRRLLANSAMTEITDRRASLDA
jgi:heme-degrading monooxygenase HmoA